MLNEEIITQSVARYRREHDRYVKLARVVGETCQDVLKFSDIPAQVTYRAKAIQSFEGKLWRYLLDGPDEKRQLLSSVDEVFAHMGDLAGVRAAAYVEADRNRLVWDLVKAFEMADKDVDHKDSPSGYRATHCQVAVPADVLQLGHYSNLEGLTAEVQITSMLAHVWNEVEHDIRYKSSVGVSNPYEDSLLGRLSDLTKDADDKIQELLRARGDRIAQQMAPGVVELFSAVPHFSDSAASVLEVAVRVGLRSVEVLSDRLWESDPVQEGRLAVQELNAQLAAEGEEPELHDDDADVLLALLIRENAKSIVAVHARDYTGDSSASQRSLRIAKIFLGSG